MMFPLPVLTKHRVRLAYTVAVTSDVIQLLLGPLGLVLATPILAATLVLVRMVYVEDVLGDQGKP